MQNYYFSYGAVAPDQTPFQTLPSCSHENPSPLYSLSMKQQPLRAKVVIPGKEKDRKPIDPPPIVQLRVQRDLNPSGCSVLNNPYLFCSCTLWDADENQPKAPPPRTRLETPATSPSSLYGLTVSSVHRIKDLENQDGAFFVFGDVSAGVQGRVRMKFSLYELNMESQSVHHLQDVLSDPFEVANQKDWDGVRQSTPLSRACADQGVRIRLRKESRAAMKRSLTSTGTYQHPEIRPNPLPTSQNPSYDTHEDIEDRNAKRQRSSTLSLAYPTHTSADSYGASGYPLPSSSSSNGPPYTPLGANPPTNSNPYSQQSPISSISSTNGHAYTHQTSMTPSSLTPTSHYGSSGYLPSTSSMANGNLYAMQGALTPNSSSSHNPYGPRNPGTPSSPYDMSGNLYQNQGSYGQYNQSALAYRQQQPPSDYTLPPPHQRHSQLPPPSGLPSAWHLTRQAPIPNLPPPPLTPQQRGDMEQECQGPNCQGCWRCPRRD